MDFGADSSVAKGGKGQVQVRSVPPVFSSSEEMAKGFSRSLPAATYAEQSRRGIMGDASIVGAYMKAVSSLFSLLGGEEGRRGGRHAGKIGPKLVDRNRADKRIKHLMKR